MGGGTPRTDDPTNFSDEATGYPWITPADLSGHSEMYISRGRRFLSEKGLRSSSATLLPKGTVLFSSRAPVGYVAIANREVATNQGFRSFICADGILPEYIYYYLIHARPIAEGLASGTTFLEISGTNAGRIPLLVPPNAEQKRIVARIDELLTHVVAARDHLRRASGTLTIENHAEATAAKVDRLTRSILSQAFRGELVPTEATLTRIESRPYEPASVLLARLKGNRGEKTQTHRREKEN